MVFKAIEIMRLIQENTWVFPLVSIYTKILILGWPSRSPTACSHHFSHNHYTRNRIATILQPKEDTWLAISFWRCSVVYEECVILITLVVEGTSLRTQTLHPCHEGTSPHTWTPHPCYEGTSPHTWTPHPCYEGTEYYFYSGLLQQFSKQANIFHSRI